MKKIIALVAALVLTLSLTAALADTIKIGVPDDTTNEARALQLLADNGIIELKEGTGETATKADVIADNIEIVEVQAQLELRFLKLCSWKVKKNTYPAPM